MPKSQEKKQLKKIPLMRLSLFLYISAVLLAGGILLSLNLHSLSNPASIDSLPLRDLLLWLGIVLVVARFQITSKSSQVTSTLNSTLDYCLIFAFGPEVAAVAVTLSSVYVNFIQRKALWYKALFNTAQLVLAVNAAGWLYRWAGGIPGASFDLALTSTWFRMAIPFIAFSFSNLLLVSFAVRLSGGDGLRQQIRTSHYYEVWGHYILFYLGALLSNLYLNLGWPGVLAGVVPLAWVYVFIQRFNELQEAHGALDETHHQLQSRGEELEEKNVKLEETNLALTDSNEKLSRTRKSLLRSEKMKAMGQLASGVAHDFNNILGSILARAELLQLDDHKDPKLSRGLELIRKSALDGAEVVRRIQDFSRVREHNSRDHVLVSELMDDVLEMTRPLWKDKAQKAGSTFLIEREIEEGLCIRVSAPELREVLTNLVLNAIEAMPDGGTLHLSGQTIQDKAVLQVRDTGLGMTPEVRERLFDPFFTTKGARGNGLGLSVTAGIIEAHKGTIQVESELGKGSVFTMHLPLPEPQESGTQPQSLIPAADCTAQRVLVVDDEEDVREVLVEILRLMGHEVDEASSGQAGLKLFTTNDYSLVFSDLGMPGMNGWELADLMRAESKQAPFNIVLITGWGAQIKDTDLAQHQVDRVMCKPFRIEELGALMQELCQAA
jgi:signal transduction histidine kinase